MDGNTVVWRASRDLLTPPGENPWEGTVVAPQIRIPKRAIPFLSLRKPQAWARGTLTQDLNNGFGRATSTR